MHFVNDKLTKTLNKATSYFVITFPNFLLLKTFLIKCTEPHNKLYVGLVTTNKYFRNKIVYFHNVLPLKIYSHSINHKTHLQNILSSSADIIIMYTCRTTMKFLTVIRLIII